MARRHPKAESLTVATYLFNALMRIDLMNLRILKKLSKRAAPIVRDLYKTEYEYFLADFSDNYTNTHGHDRKHWERMATRYGDCFFKRDIKVKTRIGYVLMSEQYIHPWKNTEMVGWELGYYEPEWEEATAWDILKEYIWNEFNEFSEIPESMDDDGYPKFHWVNKRRLKNPSQFFQAMSDISNKI